MVQTHRLSILAYAIEMIHIAEQGDSLQVKSSQVSDRTQPAQLAQPAWSPHMGRTDCKEEKKTRFLVSLYNDLTVSLISILCTTYNNPPSWCPTMVFFSLCYIISCE